jgi:hypothetical protein
MRVRVEDCERVPRHWFELRARQHGGEGITGWHHLR